MRSIPKNKNIIQMSDKVKEVKEPGFLFNYQVNHLA